MATSAQEFQKLLQQLGKRCQESNDLNEREVIDLWLEQGFFSALGYGQIGEDVRLERPVLKKGRADVILRAFTGRPTCLIEFKRPGTVLEAHVGQLADYVGELLPQYAVLTNGDSAATILKHYTKLPEVVMRRFVESKPVIPQERT